MQARRVKENYKDPDMLPKVIKADMAGTLRPSKNISDHAIVSTELLLHVVRKTTIQTYGDYFE